MNKSKIDEEVVMSKFCLYFLLMTCMASLSAAPAVIEGNNREWCDGDCEVFDEEELMMDEPCIEYFPGRHCHRPYWRDDVQSRDIDADWPGKMHYDSLYDSLTN
jgi:hypothetical protein